MSQVVGAVRAAVEARWRPARESPRTSDRVARNRRDAVRIGTGAAYSEDRIDPGVEMARRGRLDYLVFECLAERTLALAQVRRLKDPRAGSDPWLEERFRQIVPIALAQGTRIISNMGAADPAGAAERAAAVLGSQNLRGVRIAAVEGDDLLSRLDELDLIIAETGEPVRSLPGRLVSANAHIGADTLVEALAAGAQVVLAGRVSDPSLYVAGLRHAFGWAADDWPRIGAGIAVGHLLECGALVTGGFYADPPYKVVPDLARASFPLAEVAADGTAVITKLEGSGGLVNVEIVLEQLLHEVHDPAAYLTPDGIADFSRVCLEPDGVDRVRVSSVTARPRPARLKVSIGIHEGFIGEGEISYAGSGALDRARLAALVVRERLEMRKADLQETRVDFIGWNAVHGSATPAGAPEPYEVRLRVAGRAATEPEAAIVGDEVESLYVWGPVGGGGARKAVRPVVAVYSALVPREKVATHLSWRES
ncbi:MAG: DUF1446 domain-containing protein [Candidatus Rokubacteria bacterium]|nr:DUF1446 domain-containing protein [Candidatus Rokubacteria bacterium]